MRDTFGKPPTWFWIVGVVLLLWGLVGIASFYFQVTLDAPALAAMSAYDRQLLQATPGWINIVYALATTCAVLGSIALLLRSAHARTIYLVSLGAVVLQFGFMLGATDLIAVKGFLVAAGFPIFIVLMAIFQLWFARVATGRGWLR